MKKILVFVAFAVLSSIHAQAQTNSIQLRNGSNSLILAAPSGGAGGNYVLLLPASNGTNGQVLSTNGSGTLSWTTITSGATSLDGLSDAKSGGTNFSGSIMLGQEPGSLGVNANYNTAVGIGALSDLATGDNNVAVGYNALNSGADATECVAIGYNALAAGADGYAGRVVAIGPNAGASCLSCAYSVFIGRNAGTATDASADNTVVGNDAFRFNTSGADNTVIGANALENQSTGNANTALGRFAGVNKTTGSANVFLGYGAGPATALAVSNSLYINNSASNTPLIKGDFGATTLTFNGSVTTTGTSALNGNVTVGGGAAASEVRMLEPSAGGSNYTAFKAQAQAANVTYTLPAADGTSGQALTTNGSGTLSWGSIASSLDGLSDAKVEGAQFTGSMILGHQTTGSLSNATQNTAVGLSSMQSITSGTRNTAMGYQSLQSSTTATGNTAIGMEAGKALTTGNFNVALGAYALGGSSDAYNNVVVGSYASRVATNAGYNVVMGYDAAGAHTSGSSNTLLGYGVASTLTTGGTNVIVGATAGSKIVGGSGNVILGSSAGPTGNVSNALYIDNTETDLPLIYGDFNTNSLIINGTLMTSGSITMTNGIFNRASADDGGEIQIQYGDADGYWIIDEYSPTAGSEERLRIYPNTSGETSGISIEAGGNVGMGTNNPTQKLEVNGTVKSSDLARNIRNDVTGGTHVVTATDSWIIVDRGFGTTTITLPAAADWPGRELMFKAVEAQAVISDASNVVPITGGAAGTAILPATDGAWATLVSDGSNWIIMQRGQ